MRWQQQLDLSLEEAAEGILTIVNANMANAISSRTVQKGLDPRDFALVAFGGAGPLHGAEVARALGIPEIVVPPYPGITSAVGLLTTDLKYDAVRTEFQVSGAVDINRLNADFAAMQDELKRQLVADGVRHTDTVFLRAGDLRYLGQGYELRVPFPDLSTRRCRDRDGIQPIRRAASRRIRPRLPRQPDRDRQHPRDRHRSDAKDRRAAAKPTAAASLRLWSRPHPALFAPADELQTFPTPFYRRAALPLGEAIAGPAVILQTDSTTVVPPGATATADPSGNLILRLEE